VKRRAVITLLGGAAMWPVAARSQQSAMPLIGFVSGRSPGSDAYLVEGFRRGLREIGLSEGQNVALEFRWADGQLDRLPAMIAELTASVEADFETAFAALVEKRASALIVSDDALFTNRRDVLAALAARHAVPAIYGRREFAHAGGLTSYGASTLDQYYQSGVYVGRILRGAKPADLPFQLPTKFELALNLRTAKALGLTIPATLLFTADEVIE
jgi:ABC transporter substrate binding protein